MTFNEHRGLQDYVACVRRADALITTQIGRAPFCGALVIDHQVARLLNLACHLVESDPCSVLLTQLSHLLVLLSEGAHAEGSTVPGGTMPASALAFGVWWPMLKGAGLPRRQKLSPLTSPWLAWGGRLPKALWRRIPDMIFLFARRRHSRRLGPPPAWCQGSGFSERAGVSRRTARAWSAGQ